MALSYLEDGRDVNRLQDLHQEITMSEQDAADGARCRATARGS
ncbi:MAG: hypothetical protein U5K43_00705 [Halofilum sp. (in: g-proteobacteria)]|nr:hypothetical protein [Halofilum sp. (in: g-proteobacteria)]